MARVLLDENVPYGVRRWLEAELRSVEVSHVHDLGFAARTDEDLYRWALTNEAVIVTYDEDFADRRRFSIGGSCGIVRLKVEPTTEATTRAALTRVLEAFSMESILGKLLIVDSKRIRVVG